MSGRTWISAGELAGHAIAEAEVRTEFPEIRGLHTGIASVDEKLSPALEAGRLIVIAGESGRGKTALAAQLALGFAHQVPVLLASLEDDAVDSVRRVIANAARVPVSGLRSGFRSGSVPQSARAGAELLAGLPFDIDSTPCDVTELARRAHQWVGERGNTAGPLRGVLIVDQLSHLLATPYDADIARRFEEKGLPVPPKPRDSEHIVLEWQTAWMREIAVRLGLCVVLLHQLNDIRDDGGRPNASSVRGSRGIVHKADAVLIPWRPRTMANPFAGPGDPKTIPAPEDAAELICIKGRSIADGWSVKLRWDGAHQRFAEPDDQAAAYAAPAGFTPRALEGAGKLAALRATLAAQRAIAAATPQAITAADEPTGEVFQ